jgi:hypothetical protein
MKSYILLAAACAIALASCAKDHPTAPIVAAPAGPAAISPTGAVQRLFWAIQTHDVAAYTGLLTDDFGFVFARSDSAGNGFPDRSMDRTLEGEAMQHMLVGGGSIPPASDIRLTIENVLVAQPDPRPGMDLKWHRSVRTSLNCQITSGHDGTLNVNFVSGYALFCVVRGDSAVFLPGRPAAHDSTLWFISRWEDDTAGSVAAPGLHADPTRLLTLGGVKVSYLASGAPSVSR